jgi:hypothetical protein
LTYKLTSPRFLSASGIDSVKTDTQYLIDDIGEAPDRLALTTAYQNAWAAACNKFFANRGISCMSMLPQTIFHSQLPLDMPRMVVRNSDDYFPNIPSSHAWHVFCNAHNALLTKQLNALPDWDMFQTSHPYSGFHAAARCVSGGPIYCTDTPGQHGVLLIKQMTASTPRGDIILRPAVASSTKVYSAYEDKSLCTIGSYHEVGGTMFPILGVFNVNEEAVSELIPLVDFPKIDPDTEYILYAFSTQTVFPSSVPTYDHTTIQIKLPVRGYEILTAIPVIPLELGDASKHKSLKLAALGLIDKMSGIVALQGPHAAIVSESTSIDIGVNLKALGEFGESKLKPASSKYQER